VHNFRLRQLIIYCCTRYKTLIETDTLILGVMINGIFTGAIFIAPLYLKILIWLPWIRQMSNTERRTSGNLSRFKLYLKIVCRKVVIGRHNVSTFQMSLLAIFWKKLHTTFLLNQVVF